MLKLSVHGHEILPAMGAGRSRSAKLVGEEFISHHRLSGLVGQWRVLLIEWRLPWMWGERWRHVLELAVRWPYR